MCIQLYTWRYSQLRCSKKKEMTAQRCCSSFKVDCIISNKQDGDNDVIDSVSTKSMFNCVCYTGGAMEQSSSIICMTWCELIRVARRGCEKHACGGSDLIFYGWIHEIPEYVYIYLFQQILYNIKYIYIFDIIFHFTFNMMHPIHCNTCVCFIFCWGGQWHTLHSSKWTILWVKTCLDRKTWNMSNDKPWPALMSCHSYSLTGLHGTCCTQKNIHPSSISTISKTSIFPELSSSKRVKALKRTQTRNSLMDVTWKKREKWLQQQQPSKYQTEPWLRHNCHGTNKIHFDALSVQHLFGSGLPHKHVDHGQPDLWCTIFSTSTILITPSDRT